MECGKLTSIETFHGKPFLFIHHLNDCTNLENWSELMKIGIGINIWNHNGFLSYPFVYLCKKNFLADISQLHKNVSVSYITLNCL